MKDLQKKKEENVSRRDFFKDAAKKALPFIALVGLMGSTGKIFAHTSSEPAYSCNGTCSGLCEGCRSCTGTCSGLCEGCRGCSGTCSGLCEGCRGK